MRLPKPRLLALPLFLLAALSLAGNANSAQACSITLGASNQGYNISSSSCSQLNIVFKPGISNSGIVCSNTSLASSSSITAEGNDTAVYLRNCTLDGPRIWLAGRTSLYIIGDDNPVFSPEFVDNSSNITVMHYLRINVFEPFGYDTYAFGNRAAGFSYIFPLMNNTFVYNNSELQMNEFSLKNFSSEFASLADSDPAGAYNMAQSNIPANYSKAAYGKIKGSKVFLLSDYKVSRKGIVRYNPYEIDYSFLAYDQLVMYRLNVTRNINLTPMYIQPIFPPFNFQILPDNGTNTIEIRYIVAVPPQDANWNFTDYLYRYDPSEFTTNPVSGGVGSHSVLYKAFARPGSAPNFTENGTDIYLVNYTAHVALGINSSIMTAQGYIPGLGSFIQDSTTPSFSFGLGYCALPDNFTVNNVTVSVPPMAVNRSGTYNMVGRLMPIAQPATPQLVNRACSVGVVVTGKNIDINCSNGTINDTAAGILVTNSSNVNIRNCNVEGNGISIKNSQGISFYNVTLEPSSAANGFGVNISDVEGVDFYNLSIGKGYGNVFEVFSSSGTPFSEGIEIYNLSACGQSNIAAVRQYAFIYSSRDTCASGLSELFNTGISPLYELAALSIALIAAYAYIFLKHGHGRARKRNVRSSHARGLRQ
jgi:hypothetical protein